MQFFRNIAAVVVRRALPPQIGSRGLQATSLRQREVDDRKEMLRSLPTKDEGTAGEKLLDIDTMITQQVLHILGVIYSKFELFLKETRYFS